MGDQYVEAYGGSKDKVGHSLKLTLIKTTQRFKISSKNKNANEFGDIDILVDKVRKQLNDFNRVEKSWNKYEEKYAEAAAASKSLEKAIMISAGVKHDNSILEISPGKSQESFEDMKKKLEQYLKELKDADNIRQNYFAYRRLCEKTADPRKKDSDKRHADQLQVDLSQKFERLQREIPKQILDNETRMYGYMKRYYKKKRESSAEVVESTQAILDQLNQMEFSNPTLKLSESTTTTSNRNSICSNISTQPISNGEYSNPGRGTIPSAVPPTQNSSTTRNSHKPPYPVFGRVGANSNNGTDLTTKPKPFNVVATFAYKSEEEDELEFEAGDQITVKEWPCPEDEEPGWLYGRHAKTGKEGLLPANHVKLP